MGHLCHTDHGSPGGRHPGNYLHVKRWDFGERFGSRSLGGSPGARGICSYFQWKPSGATEWSFPTTSKRRTEKTHRNPQNVPGEFSHGFPMALPKKGPQLGQLPLTVRRTVSVVREGSWLVPRFGLSSWPMTCSTANGLNGQKDHPWLGMVPLKIVIWGMVYDCCTHIRKH